jgi:hypothetical protein
MLALALVALAGAAALAQQPPCLPGCDPMNPDPTFCCPTLVDAPCDEYRICQEDNRTAVAQCVSDFCLGRGPLGGCTPQLRCSRDCAARTRNCAKDLRSSLQDAGGCAIGQGTARRVCNGCGFPQPPPVCSELDVETSGSRCQRQCIVHQPWIRECYAKCGDRCAGDRCALAVCRQGCRDSICTILQNTCVPNGDRPRNGAQRALWREYGKCCANSDCSEDGSDTIVCESTSTTSTSSSTSSTRQTTSTTTISRTTTTSTIGTGQ